MIYRQAYFGVLGLLIGDALGVPYEFTKPEGIPPFEDIKYKPPQGFKRAHNVFPGTWSDDGSQALCVLDALLDVEEFHEPHGPSFEDNLVEYINRRSSV